MDRPTTPQTQHTMTHRRSRPKHHWCFPTHNLINHFPPGTNTHTIAKTLGTTTTTIHRWKNHNINLTPYQADHYAIKLGEHPSMIWTNWFDLPELASNKQGDNNAAQR
jgi:hypothetical protein